MKGKPARLLALRRRVHAVHLCFGCGLAALRYGRRQIAFAAPKNPSQRADMPAIAPNARAANCRNQFRLTTAPIKAIQFDTTLRKDGVWVSNAALEDEAGPKEKIKGRYTLATKSVKVKIRNITGDEIILDCPPARAGAGAGVAPAA
jgi:hypothetical protein